MRPEWLLHRLWLLHSRSCRARPPGTRARTAVFQPESRDFDASDRTNQAILSALAGLVQGEHAILTKLTKPHVWGAHAQKRRAHWSFSTQIDSFRRARSGEPSQSFGRGSERARRHACLTALKNSMFFGTFTPHRARAGISCRKSIVLNVADQRHKAAHTTDGSVCHSTRISLFRVSKLDHRHHAPNSSERVRTMK